MKTTGKRIARALGWTAGGLLGLAVIGVAGFFGQLYIGPDETVPPDLAALDRTAKPARQDGPRNVVLILADDLGYGTLNAYGGKLSRTPHIDALAAEGVRFTQAYATGPVCAPSRAGLMSGRYQQSFGFEYNPNVQFSELERRRQMPGSIVTIAEMVRAAGYHTGMVGKWHLGVQKESVPQAQGFEETFVLLHGASSFITRPQPGDVTDKRFFMLSGGVDRNLTPIERNGERVQVDEYLTDRFTAEAQGFIIRHRAEPFMLYLAYTDPHGPMEAPARYLSLFPNLKGEERTYAAKVAALDAGVGKVVETLKQQGLYENTTIIFASDNGCPEKFPWCEAGPVSNFKGTVFDGGVRVPLILRDPTLPPDLRGNVNDKVASLLDVMPTVARITGVTPPDGYQGVDLAQVMAGGADRSLFWRAGRAAAVRDGDSKFVSYARAGEQTEKSEGHRPATQAIRAMLGLDHRQHEDAVGPVYSADPSLYPRADFLFDVAADPGEKNDLTPQAGAEAERLRTLLDGWSRQQAQPAWGDAEDGGLVTHNGQRLSAH